MKKITPAKKMGAKMTKKINKVANKALVTAKKVVKTYKAGVKKSATNTIRVAKRIAKK